MSNTPSFVACGDELVGRYRLERVIGLGSYGRVFLATDLETGRSVAIKEFDRQQGRADGFLRELGILFELEHPRVVRCESLFMTGRSRFLVYEYLEGGSLRDFLKSSSYGVVAACRLIRQAAIGVAHAHRSGIIHRDLKPENILIKRLCGSLQAKVTDFGIAVLRSSGAVRCGLGSPAYMAPEQFYDRFDHRVDVYALGIMLFEACCGRRPFVGPPNHVARAQLHRAPELPQWLPPKMSRLLRDCLEKNPELRPSSVDELVQRLEIILDEEGPRFEQDGWPIELPQDSRLLATPEYALIHDGESLSRFDLRGRLVATYPNVSDVVTNTKHFVIKQDETWTLVTPVGRRMIPGIPEDARVALSAEGAVIYVRDGGAVTIDDAGRQELFPAGSGVVHACFVGAEQQPWLVIEDGDGVRLDANGRSFVLPESVERLCGHSERDELLARSKTTSNRWYSITLRGVRPFEMDCDRFQCDGENFVAARTDGTIVSVNATSHRVAETMLDADLATLAVSRGLTVWANRNGAVRSLAWKMINTGQDRTI